MNVEDLRRWFVDQKRDLPWRIAKDPYSVFISEIMLQQTQVSVVIPYYLRWMEKFPSFEVLANASEIEVLKSWEGLGYYSRARNLRKAAQFICKTWQGKMPESVDHLSQIPGIGPYTAGAIRAFAFHEKAAAVDGNVMRVLSRYFAIYEDIGKSKGQKQMRELAETILPEESPWIIAEGLIELGALVCKKKPLCEQCPLKSSCQAFQKDLIAELPVKEKKMAHEKLYRTVPVLIFNDRYLIRRIPEGSLMGGLHEFPYFETDERKMDVDVLKEKILSTFNLKTTAIRKFPQVQHGFTRYKAYLDPFLFQCKNNFTPSGYFWAASKDLSMLAFSSGHRKILRFAS